MTLVLGVQVATYLLLGVLFLGSGNVRLCIAQFLLAAVQAVIYSGGLK